MPTQDPELLTETAMLTWRKFLRAHCAITRQLDSELTSEHGLTLNDYAVLLQLKHAEGGRMRMSELAGHVQLTRSGITRLVDGLVGDGFVERVSCATDARVSYAVLTPGGKRKLGAAAQTHLTGIQRAFVDPFSEQELQVLDELLGRLRGAGDLCEGGTSDMPPCGG